MNKIYRLIWNPALRTWVAVSEFAKANGKGKSGRTGLSATAAGLIGALTLSSLVSTSAYADDPVTTSTDPDSVTIGTNAETGDTTTLDANTITTGNTNVNQQELSNVAVGESAKAAMGGIALGDHADADTSTSQTPGGSVAIGAYATANKSGGATAIGLASEADGQNAVAFGAGAHANRSGDIAIGYSSTSGTYTGTQNSNDLEGENISLGNWSTAYGGQALAVGNHAEATAKSSMALGIGSRAYGVESLSIGSDSTSSGNNSLAIGSDSTATGVDAQAIGNSATASGESSLAIGSHASSSDKQSFAVGYKAQATKADTVALGTQAKAQGDRALSFGYNSSATKNDAIAMGSNAKAQGMSSLAFGTNATSADDNSVALGSSSLTAAAVGTQAITIDGKTYAFAGTAPLSTVSIGKKDAERTLTNLAAGRISKTSTDAINGSQLFAATQATEALANVAVKYDLNQDSTVNYDSITLNGDTYDSTDNSGGTTITNIARGVDDSDAVNMSQLNETNADVADVTNIVNNIAGDTSTTYTDLNGKGIRYARTNEKGLTQADAYAKGKGSSAVGYSATAIGENSLALGYNAKANNAKDVALGADSLTAAAVATTGTTLRGEAYTFAGTAPASTVSIGSVGKERTLTNLAAGRLSATSTDAVNGSQLYATNQAIDGISGDISDLSDLAVKYDTNPDGTINYNRVSMGGTTYNSTTKAGGTTLTNVAYGVNDSDAVNVQQLRDATSDMYNNGVKYFHANSTKADSVATGTDSIAVGPAAKSVGESSIAMGNAATSTGAGSMAMGQNARSTGENSVAIGAGAVANNKGDVALGAGATTEQAVGTQGVTIRGNDYQFAGTTPTGTVSVGSLDNERTITNVAAGRISATSTDAVNGSQLYATNQAIEAINTNFSGLDNSVVKYVVNGDGSIDYSKIALAGDTYDQSTKTGGTTITNVAAGVNASDAVNKQQLDEVSLNVTNIAEGKDGMFQVNNTSNLPKPKPTGQNSIAGGAGAVAGATNSMALGNSAKATHSNAVALGTNSVTDRDNSVSMGYAGGERQITHVAAGTAATDAVNVGQLKQSMGDSYTYTNNKFGELKEMIADQDDKLSAGIAGAMAMASLPQPYSPGASMFSMAGGTYQGESAIAMGVSTVSDNGKWVTKLSGSSNSQGDLGGSVGIGYQW
ncbi:YadA-like family protein [Leclercia pneumoniae]|uniref:YadA-like family protein n=1 Tax=Leclercia pneumoniae TaxID=2815358 RepID=A0ABX8JXK2_9ENTR|nr:YadA-like family protein [Leclercia pneumoniae]QSW35319.1 YadA-like family protein [Leclercia pneumoniae]QWW79758.1 YadA-like family protein [Leclercia pneumoniae]